MSFTIKVLHDLENINQSEDLIDLTINPQEVAATAKLQVLAIQTRLDTMAESFSIQADALATWFLTLLCRLYTKHFLNPQKREEHKSWWEGLLAKTSHF